MAIDAAIAGYGLTPYCGAPAGPASLWQRWNLDPVLLAGLAAVLILYLLVARGGWRRGWFCLGWALGALALVSPLCALSVSLFSARVAQHMLLTVVVAPMIAAGLPRSAQRRSSVIAAAAIFAAILWLWHAPGPYMATFRSEAVYWLMHISLISSALWLWRGLLPSSGEPIGARVVAIAITSAQMGLLGAILTFAPSPVYAAHVLTTRLWDLSPLEDQQLGGAIMWIPAGVIFVSSLLLSLAGVMRRAEPASLAG